MKKTKLCTILIVVLVLVGYSGSSCQMSDSQSDVAESYAVYSEVLKTEGLIRNPLTGEKPELLVIDEETNTDRYAVNPIEILFQNTTTPFPEEYMPALTDYRIKNLEPEKLTKSFDVEQNYVLINGNDFRAHFNEQGNLGEHWESFYRKHPNSSGFITFSKVGFDAEKKNAFVYVEINCGSLCASANYILLKKEWSRWKQVSQAVAWVS